MSQEKFRLGRYWLDQVDGSRNWYRFWYDAGAEEVRRRSLKTADFEGAKIQLAALVLKEGEGRAQNPGDVALLTVFTRYWEERSDHRPNPSAARRAGSLCLDFLGDNAASVGALTKTNQQAFIKWLRTEHGHAVGYISRVQSIINAALRRYVAEDDEDDGALLTRAPRIIYGKPIIAEILDAPEPVPDNWHPTFEQLAAFIETIPVEEETRILRFVLMMVAFAGRPEAVKEAASFQLDTRYRILDFNAPGRRQSKKHRPALPVPELLWPDLEAWSREADHFVHKNTRPVRVLRKPWYAIQRAAGLPAEFRPKSLRHFMGTELRRRQVPREQREIWMGHRRPSTNDQYGIFDSAFLNCAKSAANDVLAELAESCDRPLFRQIPAKSGGTTLRRVK